MKWFKFYGQDFITDSKMGYLSTPQRLIWVYLLCMASQSDNKDGILKYISLDHLRALAGITENDENWKLTEGTLELFEEMELVTINNEIVTINNYKAYQETALTNAERQTKFRNKKKDSNEIITDDNANSNARVDKNRVDKNKKEEKRSASQNYLENLLDKDVEEFKEKYNCSTAQILGKADALVNYCKAKGKKYKDYRAFLQNALLKDFGLRPISIGFKPDLPEQEISQEKREEFKRKREELLGKVAMT